MVLSACMRPFLTLLSRINFPISIVRTSLFQILVLGGILIFYSNSNRTICKQTVVNVVRAVCLCPTKKDAVLIWVKYQVGLDNLG